MLSEEILSFNCTTIHRYPIFSTRYSVMCKVYTGYCGKARRLSPYRCTNHALSLTYIHYLNFLWKFSHCGTQFVIHSMPSQPNAKSKKSDVSYQPSLVCSVISIFIAHISNIHILQCTGTLIGKQLCHFCFHCHSQK